MDLVFLLKDFIRCNGNFQLWLKRRSIKSLFGDLDTETSYFRHVETSKGDKFLISENLDSVLEAARDYCYHEIKPNDIVIDIGANVGGFSIPASHLCKKVISVEPIMTEELKYNVILNNRQNIEILEVGLGNGQVLDVTWRGKNQKTKTMTLSEIVLLAGGCDFLKCDCEGFEWFIEPEDLSGIRHVDIETHHINPSENDPEELLAFIRRHYNINSYLKLNKNPIIRDNIHAERKN